MCRETIEKPRGKGTPFKQTTQQPNFFGEGFDDRLKEPLPVHRRTQIPHASGKHTIIIFEQFLAADADLHPLFLRPPDLAPQLGGIGLPKVSYSEEAEPHRDFAGTNRPVGFKRFSLPQFDMSRTDLLRRFQPPPPTERSELGVIGQYSAIIKEGHGSEKHPNIGLLRQTREEDPWTVPPSSLAIR